MAPHPRVEELPERFPVFPLAGALLLPGGRLPLNIFEPRYLAMTEDALAAGRLLGMIQPDATRPANVNGPGLYSVGCLGRLCSFAETDDGRYLITLCGVARFVVAEELEPRHGYRMVRADFRGFADDLAAEPPPVAFDRPALLAALRAYFTRRGLEANWDAIQELPDVPLITTLSMVCPFSAAEKQALLEAPTATERAKALLALLSIDAHEPGGEGASPQPPRAS